VAYALCRCRMSGVLAVLGIVGLIVTACGSSGHGAKHVAASRAWRDGAPTSLADAERPPSPGQANAFARTVSLHHDDVPGFGVSSNHQHQTAAEERLEDELGRCLEPSGSERPLGEARSPEFERNSNGVEESVESDVSVARTPALAARELAEARNRKSQACLVYHVAGLLRTQPSRGATISPISVFDGIPRGLGSAGSFGLRITATVAVQNEREPVYVDFLGFVYGRAEVSLLASGVPRPILAATEERLLRLLLARAKVQDP